MASKECEQKSWFKKRSFENVETEPEFPTPCPPKKKRALRATQMIKEKDIVKEEKANPKLPPYEVDRLNNEKNINPGLKAEPPERKEYFESKSENAKSVKQGLEILKSKLKPVEEGNLLVKKENGTQEIQLSHSDVKMEPVEDENSNPDIMNPVVKSDMIAEEYQIKTDKCVKKEVKLESMGILESKLDVKIEPFEIDNCETDVEERKIFVGGLPIYAQGRDIQDYFEKFGEIEEINLKTNPLTGRSRGFSFVSFKTVDGFVKALLTNNHVLWGKAISIKKAESKQGKIYVGKIPVKILSEEIKSHFSKFGTIALIEQPVDKITKKRKDFCFITFEKESSAKQLIEMGATTINGVQINVKKVIPPNQKIQNLEHNEMQGFGAFRNWFHRPPMPFLGPTPFFGPGPFFGGWHNC